MKNIWPNAGGRRNVADRLVCDTSALVACCLKEPGADVVQKHLELGGCVMHAINVSEICFTLPRKRPGEFDRHSARAWLLKAGVEIISGFDEVWADKVAEIRLKAMALNIGDGVAVALAGALGVPLLAAEGAFANASDFAAIELIR